MTQSEVKVTSPRRLEILPFSKNFSSAVYNGSCQLTTDSYTGTISKFDRAGFLIFVLVFVTRDFELGRNVRCKESTVSPVRD